MLYTKKYLLYLVYSAMTPVFFLSINVLYDQKAYAEEWKPSATQYTLMNMLTESLFINNETGDRNNSETESNEAIMKENSHELLEIPLSKNPKSGEQNTYLHPF